MRTLYLNLKDKQNPALRNEIVLNYITADQVANMSKDVSTSNLAVIRVWLIDRKWHLKV